MAAERSFRGAVQVALSCVSEVIALSLPSEVPGQLGLRPSTDPIALTADFQLQVRLRYRLASVGRRWQAETVAYSYLLLNREGLELLALQWDLLARSPVTTPHLHVGRALDHPALPLPFRRGLRRLVKAHVPTGFVSVSAILRTTIDDLGAPPARPDWDRRLAEADAAIRASFPRE